MSFLPGDIIGFSGGGHTGRLISVATLGWPFSWPVAWSSLSHVGIVAPWHHSQTSDLLLFESTSLCDEPCEILGRRIIGVQAHAIGKRIRSYHDHGGVAWHYPLMQPLDVEELFRLAVFCRQSLGIGYDTRGAFDSRDLPIGRLFRAVAGREDLARLFCSEFCAAALRRAGAWKIANVSGLNPNRMVRRAIREGVLRYPGRLYPETETPARAA